MDDEAVETVSVDVLFAGPVDTARFGVDSLENLETDLLVADPLEKLVAELRVVDPLEKLVAEFRGVDPLEKKPVSTLSKD